MPTPLVGISYKNVSGSAIPPYGVVQASGAPYTSSNGDIAINVTKPGSGSGPWFIDDGTGAAASGDGAFGTCYRASEGFTWVYCTSMPTDPWTPVGPVHDSFGVSGSGAGLMYTGKKDPDNNRILVTKSIRAQPLWCKTTSVINTGTPSIPSTFTVNAWVKTGSTWPYSMGLTTDTGLQGLTVVNRSPNLTTSTYPVVAVITWNDELCEYEPTWVDCE